MARFIKIGVKVLTVLNQILNNQKKAKYNIKN